MNGVFPLDDRRYERVADPTRPVAAVDGKFHYVHNYLQVARTDIVSPDTIPAGTHTLTVHFTPTKKNLKPDYFIGDLVMMVNGQKVAEHKDLKMAGQYSAAFPDERQPGPAGEVGARRLLHSEQSVGYSAVCEHLQDPGFTLGWS